MARYYDYMDCPADGMPVATIIIAIIAIVFALLRLNEITRPRPVPPSPPKEPTKAPPKVAPGLPYGAADAVEGELKVLQAQLSAFGYSNLDPLLGPALHRVVGMVADYEKRVERMHEKARKEIENA